MHYLWQLLCYNDKNWAVTENIRSARLKIFTIQPFTEKSANLYSEWLFFKISFFFPEHFEVDKIRLPGLASEQETEGMREEMNHRPCSACTGLAFCSLGGLSPSVAVHCPSCGHGVPSPETAVHDPRYSHSLWTLFLNLLWNSAESCHRQQDLDCSSIHLGIMTC